MLENICQALCLGALRSFRPLTGGYTHRMMDVQTASGRYAIKLLNPDIMARPDALANFARAEAFEAHLEAAGLPILPARVFNGRKLQQVCGQSLYVFDYFDGHPLTDEAITPAHCTQMGQALARIHRISQRQGPEPDLPAPIDWLALADALLAISETRAEGLRLYEALPLLCQAEAAANDALRRLPRHQTICHWDMDPKNVLWQGDIFRIIDLECLDWGNPHQELLDQAVSWGGWPLDEARFKAFVGAYLAAGGTLPSDAATVVNSRRNHIDWLAYNARRALSPHAQESATGRSQLCETIGKIRCDQANRPLILRAL